MTYCFKIAILVETCIKMRYFIEKLRKSPRPPPTPGLRILGYTTGTIYVLILQLYGWHKRQSINETKTIKHLFMNEPICIFID